MSLLRMLSIAGVVVLGLSGFANAATRQHHQVPRQDIVQPSFVAPQVNGRADRPDPYYEAPTTFQDQFKNY